MERPVELPIAAAVEPMAPLLSARGVDRAGAGERGEGCLASHPTGVAAGDEQLRTADRAHAALLEQRGRDLGDERCEGTLGLRHLVRQPFGAPAEAPQNAVHDLAAGPQPGGRAGEGLPAERSQTLAHADREQ